MEKKDLQELTEKVNKLQKENEALKKKLLLDLDQELKARVAKKIAKAEEEIKLVSEERARQILVEAMKHGATDITAEYTVSSVKVPSEDIKGKIIGREGRNIRVFERATGVDLDLEEEGEIRLSSFDSQRREIAKRALQKLIRDGRIQPNRIEEVVDQVKQEVEKIILEEGNRLCQAVGVYDLPLELVKMIGQFKFRFSYGQNLLVHTLEETKIAIEIANQLKADIDTVRLGCLLHDVGKVVTDRKGSHVDLGVEIARKYNMPEKVISAIAEHHEDKPFSSIESAIIWVADAISGSRPAARYEPHEDYIERMTQIEDIARSFPEVVDVAAYQAGREVRVVVEPEKTSDEEVTILAHEIAKELEEVARWAGRIRVTVIRETRATKTAPLTEED
ncbi:MAG: HDIG domain-containing protein [Candidatus Shapirobacteria bacterium]|nr:HDIG domain-containing protein [Candidatus Shapirobacteria bacterium]